MKLTSKVDGLQYNVDTREKIIRIQYDIDLEISDDDFFNKKKIIVLYDKNGKILRFPNLGDNSYENPIKYVVLGKAVEEILAFEGDRIKNVYDKAIEIEEFYKKKIIALKTETNYNELSYKRHEINTLIGEKLDSLNKARKEERKKILREEIDSLILEREKLNYDKINPIEWELVKLKDFKEKSITELEV